MRSVHRVRFVKLYNPFTWFLCFLQLLHIVKNILCTIMMIIVIPFVGGSEALGLYSESALF
jgi:hypothetical protein